MQVRWTKVITAALQRADDWQTVDWLAARLDALTIDSVDIPSGDVYVMAEYTGDSEETYTYYLMRDTRELQSVTCHTDGTWSLHVSNASMTDTGTDADEYDNWTQDDED